ncbi:MAG: 23S rRNA (adenine(2503)-C(2))-methyltransferase [Bacteroidetes bacterium GWE2_39_28]|nr:MAG: 23S rRNA (adenine(2503)-C(2))-methyltransferase [Bacteroidetes bacterium GWE2_39_28]OFY12419.1 MAG: 23S rRNA (adenine(2503)-C(2))-methyltransferase [Bacteroidetes bacterium GWF2_39_10]OFZ09837.1 MAG: 23S rRNA (adenine(2503)-C(2))-methyltransferase [Bacteroidetes bacterium RIFOXYC2_FULL_39_11]HCT93360.1 23S rRNA (adenine(2503)-C(2))-methyltransferase RlmN [Rikenellaceae bacterium]
MKKWLLGNTLPELKLITESLSLPSFTAKQISDWIYKKRVSEIALMTNLSASARDALSSTYEVGGFAPSKRTLSKDGTKKYLFPSFSSAPIEAVMIPDEERSTLCISSQSGCKMGCLFCMTGRMGFKGHLSTGEIISQIMNVDEAENLTNIVYMGMGEPMDNIENVLKSTEIMTADWGFGWSPKRITVSTIGVPAALKSFLDRSKCHLALSLHNPYDNERAELMPVQKAWPLDEIISLIKSYDFTGQRRVSFEYIMFSGWNDTKRHADALTRMLKGLECRVNLIRFHQIPDFSLKSSPDLIIENFRNRLNAAGIMTTIRASRGEDILAACGMLSSKSQMN